MINTTLNQIPIWYDQSINTSSALYNIGGYVRIDGKVDTELFEHTLTQLIKNSDVLKAKFIEVDGLPKMVLNENTYAIAQLDYSNRTNAEHDCIQDMQRWMFVPIDRKEKQLFDFKLIKTSDSQYFWFLKLNHLIIDGFGISVMVSQLADMYNAALHGEKMSMVNEYHKAIADDEKYQQSPAFEASKAYWQKRFDNYVEVAPVGFSVSPQKKVLLSKRKSLPIKASTYQKIKAFATENGATPFHYFLTCINQYFFATKQINDLCIGLPILNRSGKTFKNTIGLFTGISPFRNQISAPSTFAELMAQVTSNLRSDFRHQKFPLHNIYNNSEVQKTGATSLFNIMFSFEKQNIKNFGNNPTEIVALPHNNEKLPLSIYLREYKENDDVTLDIDYNVGEWDETSIDLFVTHFNNLIQNAYQYPNQEISNTWFIKEKASLIGSIISEPKHTVIDLFDQQCTINKNKIAIADNHQQWTYDELQKKSNAVANFLKNNLKNTSTVAIIATHENATIAHILGALKAGHTYVPIDPNYPENRVKQMMQESKPAYILGGNKKQKALFNSLSVTDLPELITEPINDSKLGDIAYILYTSGSTGLPKGVPIKHVALSNYLQAASTAYFEGKGSSFALFTSLGFDLSITALFTPLIHGKQLTLIQEESPDKAIEKSLSLPGIEALKLTPSHLNLISKNYPNCSIKKIIVGGEALLPALVKQTFNYLGTNTCLINEYGPTETTVGCTYLEIHPKQANNDITIGKPLPNYVACIVNTQNQIVGKNTIGELCIGGISTSDGYVNRPELNHEKFIAINNSRYYKTGDLAFIDNNNRIWFKGRNDLQVKIRGHRIELEEIENAVANIPNIEKAVVTPVPSFENELLVCFFKGHEDFSIEEAKIKLSDLLPSYMTPTFWIETAEFETNVHGKLNTKKLPYHLIFQDTSTQTSEHWSSKEQTLKKVWNDFLPVALSNKKQHFFELGGHSLLAARIIGVLEKDYQLKLSLKDFFEHPVFEELATKVKHTFDTFQELNHYLDNKTQLASSAQKRLWVLQQFQGANTAYNIISAKELKQKTEVSNIEKALHKIVERHPQLRSTFSESEGEIYQTIEESISIPLQKLSFDTQKQFEAWIKGIFVHPFNLELAPLFQCFLVETPRKEQLLILNIHHSITDGWSMEIIWNELALLLNNNVLPNKSTFSFQQYSLWHKDYLKSFEAKQHQTFWTNYLGPNPPKAKLPFDFLRPQKKTYLGNHVPININKLSPSIKTFCETYQLSAFAFFQAATQLLIYLIGKQQDFVVGTPSAGRFHPDTKDIVGFFVNTLPVRTQIKNNETAFDFIQRTQQNILEVLSHEAWPLENIITDTNAPKSTDESPLFDVLISMEGQELGANYEDTFKNNSPAIESLSELYEIAKFDLTFSFDESDEFNGRILYNSALYKKETINNWAEDLLLCMQFLVESTEKNISELHQNFVCQQIENVRRTHKPACSQLIPLTPPQEDIFYTCLNQPQGTSLRIIGYQELYTNMDKKLWQQSVEHIHKINPILNSEIFEHAGQPYLAIDDNKKVHVNFICEAGSSFESIQHLPIFHVTHQLENPPICHALVELNPNCFAIVISMHHLLSDGQGSATLFEQLINHYQALVKQQESPVKLNLYNKPFFNHALQAIQRFNTPEALSYWNKKLIDSEALKLGSSVNKLDEVVSDVVKIEGEDFDLIKTFCKQHKLRLETFFETIYVQFIRLYSNASAPFILRENKFGRKKSFLQTVGCFTYVAPLAINPVELNQLNSFVDQCLWMEKTKKEAQDYQELSISQINRLMDKEPISFYFNYQKFWALKAPDFAGELKEVLHFMPEQIELRIQEQKTFIRLELNTNKSIWHVPQLLEQIKHASIQISNGQHTITAKHMLSAKEYRSLASLWPNGNSPLPAQHLMDQVETIITLYPDHVAVSDVNNQLTFKEVWQLSENLAAHIQKQIIGITNPRIAVIADRDCSMMVSWLACMRANACCIPIDAEIPEARKKYILHDSQPAAYIANNKIAECALPFINHNAAQKEGIFNKPGYQLNDDAYIIYTSGTTGNPKGVLVSHTAIANMANAWKQCYNFDKLSPVILQMASFSFDVNTGDIIRTLTTGGKMVICPSDIRLTSDKLYDLMHKENISFIESTPAVLTQFVNYLNEQNLRLPSLKWLVLGSDKCPLSDFKRIQKVMGSACRVINSYGVTETTIDAGFFEGTCALDIPTTPVGKPLPGYQWLVLNKNHQLSPIGTYGELFIGGKGLAKEYVNQPALTNERFVTLKEFNNQRYYATGDVVRWLPDGNLEFIGRNDSQLKVRGYRIESAEVEHQLQCLDYIHQAAVTVFQNQLAAYIVVDKTKKLSPEQIKTDLATTLPEYMIPGLFVALHKLPLTANKKIDKKALPTPSPSTILGASAQNTDTSVTENQQQIIAIWERILQTSGVHPDANFFEIGGHSLNATQLCHAYHQIFNKQMPLGYLFENPVLKKHEEWLHANDEHAIQSTIETVDLPDYPLTPAQNRLYILQQFQGAEISYNMPGALLFKGDINANAIISAFNTLINRHSILQTSFQEINGEVRQIVHKDCKVNFSEKTVIHKDELTSMFQAFVQAFDLTKAPLFRVQWNVLPNENVMFFDMHHIISDGVSMDIFIQEFLDILAKKELKPTNNIAYKDYAYWFNQEVNLNENKKYWLAQFADSAPLLTLPTDHKRPSVKSYAGKNFFSKLSSDHSKQIEAIANEHSTTPFVILLSAYYLMLSKYCQQSDVVIGMPVANRTHPQTHDVLGVFINTLPIRISSDADFKIKDIIQLVKQQVENGVANQSFPLENLINELQLEKDPSRNPLFDTLFNYLETSNVDTSEFQFEIKQLDLAPPSAKLDLSLEAIKTDDGFRLKWEYATALFEDETIEHVNSHFKETLDELIKNQSSKVHEIKWFSNNHYTLATQHILASDQPFEAKLIHQLFEQQASEKPNNIAVVDGHTSLTYQQVNLHANQLANDLISKGLTPETVVALFVKKGFETIIAMLGILKAGGAYLPIDTNMPQKRQQSILTEGKIDWLIHDNKHDWLPKEITNQTSIKTELTGNTNNPNLVVTPNQLAYVLFTSGSTGVPKGVMITHSNVSRLFINQKPLFSFTENDVWTMFHEPHFDFSVWEMYGALFFGGKLVIVNKETASNPEDFVGLLQQQKVTILNQTPGAFYQLIDEVKQRIESPKLHLRHIIFGGDALNPMRLASWNNMYPNHELVNMYGITETTVHVTFKQLTKHDLQRTHSNIGNPLPTLGMVVVDKHFNVLPPNVEGELLVCGAGLARGYFNNQPLTKERFISIPNFGNKLFYRTGDKAKMLANGEFEYIGRIDFQIQLRGYRIELGEIENAVNSHPAVSLSVAKVFGQDESAFIAQFVLCESPITTKELKAFTQDLVPAYMVPSRFILVNDFKLTKNGKIDRAALRLPTLKKETANTNLTRTEIILIEIWKDILGINTIEVSSNFFEIGGNSLSAVKLTNELKTRLQIQIPLHEIFKFPTLKDLAISVDKQNKVEAEIPLQKVEQRDYYPVSAAEKRLFLLQKLTKESTAYNIPAAYEIVSSIDSKKLQNTIANLVSRHENLRTIFFLKDGIVQRQVLPNTEVVVENFDQQFSNLQQAVDVFVRPFTLEMAPLWRVAVVHTVQQKSYLLFDFHHIIFDGISVEIIEQDFIDLYTGKKAQEIADITYKDYAEWQQGVAYQKLMLSQKQFWKEKFSDELPILNLPTDFTRPKHKSNKGARFNHVISEKLGKKINQLCQEQQVTPFMAFLSFINILLHRYTQQTDIIIGTPTSGRTRSEIKHLVGCFINTLALRNEVEALTPASSFLQQIKEQTLSAFENQDFPFEELIDELDINRDTSRNPLFDVMISYQASTAKDLLLNDSKLVPAHYNIPVAKMDLTFDVSKHGNQYLLSMEYATDLFSEKTIARMMGHLEQIALNITQHPNTPIKDVGMLTNQEAFNLKYVLNDTQFTPERVQTIVSQFYQQANKNPNNIALVDEKGSMTYAELNEQSNQLAHWLLANNASTSVAVVLPRSNQAIACIWGVLKAGKNYVPIDPATPISRLGSIMMDAKISCVICEKPIHFLTPEIGELKQLVCSKQQLQAISLLPTSKPEVEINLNQLAYILFTSGSTGQPKGVQIEHGALTNLSAWFGTRYQIKPGKHVLQMASLSFDVSIEECLVPLVYGASVHIISDNTRLDKKAFAAYINQHQISLAQFVPSSLQALVAENEAMPSLEQIIVGGDALSFALKSEVEEKGYHIYNHYGPTETTVDAIFTDFSGNQQEIEGIYEKFNQKTIHGLIEQMAVLHPANIAVSCKQTSYTYTELNNKANQLANYLVSLGIQSEEVVGICAEKNSNFIVSVLGILKAGGVFLPIDPVNPVDRINYMVSNSGARFIVSDNNHKQLFNADSQTIIQPTDYQHSSNKSVTVAVSNKQLAYVIYTSGSTGKPKGVQIEHKALNNLLLSHQFNFGNLISAKEVGLSITNVSFDVSLFEIFAPLVNGGKLLILERENIYDVNNLAQTFIDQGITLAYIAPALLQSFAIALKKKLRGQPSAFNKLIVGVEPIKDEVLALYLELNHKFRIINSYGPTEAAIYCTSYWYAPGKYQGKNVPIGKPILNTQIYIVDKHLNLQPIGVPGEICIAGAGLARGYLNRPDLTEEKFVDNPFELGTKMYRTGDLAKWNHDGNILFLGRMDTQVKIRGFRIELEEIENVMVQHPEVNKALLVDYAYPSGEKYLCAYYTTKQKIDVEDLKVFLQKKLPAYMIPAFFMPLEQFPLTPNEKIDRKALPIPNADKADKKVIPPTNKTEEKILEIWKLVLELENISVTDNFFELGGNSLKIIRLHDALQQQFADKIQVADLFDRASIKEQATIISEADKSNNKSVDEQETTSNKPRRIKL